MELTKGNKKIARNAIEKGLQIEFANGLNRAKEVIEKWESNQLENREAYHLLYNTVYDFDKHIAARYDGMTGSGYFQIVVEQFADGIINEDGFNRFSAEVLESIKEIKKRWEKND